MKWTSDQQKVIDHKDGNLLVAAAAGSGKTAVLVQHVINRITDKEDPVSLDELKPHLEETVRGIIRAYTGKPKRKSTK